MSRNTLVILILAAVVGTYFLLVAPLSDKRTALRDQMESRYSTLMKHERFISRTKKAGINIEDARKELKDMERFIIQASDDSLAFAELQTKVQDIAGSAGLKINSIKPLPLVEQKGYNRIPLFMDAVGDIGQFSQFLKRLDNTSDLIGVDSINIGTTIQDQLRIKIQLSGLMKA